MDDPLGHRLATLAAATALHFALCAEGGPRLLGSDATGVEFEHSNSDTRGQLGSGSERITTLVNSEKLVQRFLQFDPPHNYAYFTDMEKSTLEAPLDYSIARYELSSITNEVTNLKISVVYRSSSRLLGFFVRRAFVSALEKDFEKAVEIMEIEFR